MLQEKKNIDLVYLLESIFFLNDKLNFFLTGKCFSLTNFSNDKQTQKNLESNF